MKRTKLEVCVEAVRYCTDLPVRVLIRPRAGDFCYSAYEFGIMCDAVALFREEGADAVVTGCLTPEGDVDLKRMKRLREAAGPMDMTFHRAFDMARDAGQALRDIESLGGISTILTSGQAPDVEKGIGNLKAIIAGADGRLDIMPGGGVNSGNLEHLEEELHAPVYHMSGKMAVSSRMIYRNPAVSMGEDSIQNLEDRRGRSPQSKGDSRIRERGQTSCCLRRKWIFRFIIVFWREEAG